MFTALVFFILWDLCHLFTYVKLGYVELKTLLWDVTHIGVCVCVMCNTCAEQKRDTVSLNDPSTRLVLDHSRRAASDGRRSISADLLQRKSELPCHTMNQHLTSGVLQSATRWRAGCGLSGTVKVRTVREGRDHALNRQGNLNPMNYLALTISFLRV